MTLNCAVIGAGAAGLAAARRLRREGCEVAVFDKGRRWGGRLALRHTAEGSFQHGAPWASPKPSWLHEALAQDGPTGIAVHTNARVAAVVASDNRWSLRFADERPAQNFDRVVITVPQPQLAALLPGQNLCARLQQIRYAPCWTLLWIPAQPPAETALLSPPEGSLLAKLRREPVEHGGSGCVRMTAHATAAWSRQWLGAEPDAVREAMIDACASQLGCERTTRYAVVHRWLYARVEQALQLPQLTLAPGLHYASDGCLGDGLEAAAASGNAAALVAASPF